MKDDMLSALARGREGDSLIEFFAAHHLPHDCSNPHEHGIVTMVSGNQLNNENGSVVTRNDDLNFEYLVHLRGPVANCTVNLATVLAMAAAFCRQEQADAREAMKSIETQAKGNNGRGKRNARTSGTRAKSSTTRPRGAKG